MMDYWYLDEVKINTYLLFLYLFMFLIIFFLVSYLQMADPDPETLLEWLSSGLGDERDMQLIALEQLCMLLLMSDNVDRCFER